MKILISGSSGLIGSKLIPFLQEKGHTITRIVREKNDLENDTVFWDAATKSGNPADLEGFDAVINLSGENVASGRWNEAKKKAIRSSRVETTWSLCHALSERMMPPKVIISASAIGYYGNRGDILLTEESHAGNGFLAEVCEEWEAATESAVARGIRTVIPRISTVLSLEGGALAKMIKPFKLGLGGRLGSGKQYMSWIVLEDLIRLFEKLITDDNFSGPVNAASPHPVTNDEFTKGLAKAVHRSAILPVPEFVLKLALGEMAEELLLSSTRVYPKKALDEGFDFLYPDLRTSLEYLLRRKEHPQI